METAEETIALEVSNTSPIDELARNGKAFCMAPFYQLSVAIGGVAKPCCEFNGDVGHIGKQSIHDIWHGEELNEFRAKMLADEHDRRCSKCYEMEATGGHSLRKMFNTKEAPQNGPHDVKTPDSLVPPLPTGLDIRLSNLCNFSCRMCSHAASSKWFSDARKLGWTTSSEALITTFASNEEGMQALRPVLENVEEIYFAGGEPLLLEQHYAVLNELIQKGRTDVALTYNSNMSELRLGRRLNILEQWSRFKNISVEASIDGTGERGEMIREGMSWADFASNVKTVKASCPHVRIFFGVTVSVFNVWALPELHQDLVALGVGGEGDFHFHVLQEPDYYGVQILPRHLKRQVARRLDLYAGKRRDGGAGTIDNSIGGQLRHIVDHMMAEDRTELIEAFRSATLKLDEMRGRSTAAVCPELAPLLRLPKSLMFERVMRGASKRAARLQKWSARTYANALRGFGSGAA